MTVPRISSDRPVFSRGRDYALILIWGIAGACVVSALAVSQFWPDSGAAGLIVLLLLFVAIVAGSAIAGAVGGALCTFGFCGMAYAWWTFSGHRRGLPLPLVELLFAQGLLLSVVGWALGRARLREQVVQAGMRDLERRILEISEAERQRLGHDLHDGLGQHLTGISMLSESLAQHAAAGNVPTPEEVERITHLSSDAVRQARELARSLSPLTLEQEGFDAAMEELAQNASILLNVQCEWEEPEDAIALSGVRAVHLYRIVQEAVNNSVRHGKARRIRISAQTSGRQLKLEVIDDGVGLSSRTVANPGLGLRIMQYRARIAEVELAAERATVAGGTRVVCQCRMD